MTSSLLLADYVRDQRDRITGVLADYLRIPSISADPANHADVWRSAEFTADLLREAGFDGIDIVTAAGGLPAVYAEHLGAGPQAPTVLVYGHHDVQPVDPLDQWTSPPFEPAFVDGECRARGAIDDKGQVLYEIEAARGLLRRDGRLPVNLKFLVEGEEESGSPTFEALLTEHRERFACDAVVVSDTGMVAPDAPSICVGMRGLLACALSLRVADADLHSGTFGGAVANPAHVLARLVAALHDDAGRVTLPAFYDLVAEPDPAERASLAAIPFDEAAWRIAGGNIRAIAGEAGRTIVERTSTRPTAEVTGLGAGYQGPGVKTIVPAEGMAKITFRLVPDQDPETVHEALRTFVAARMPDGCEWSLERISAVRPMVTPASTPALGALARAIERVWETAPLYTREGGSGPEEALGRVLEAPVLFLGVGLPDDRIHAPNERMVMEQFWRGLLAAGELWAEMAKGER
jgi:acetylornithine deacetylase/succinyl-diaminopimelate desuccinylase-like protein